jgi:hypothetical protein
MLALWRHARTGEAMEAQDRLFVVSGAVLAANALLSYAYTKDEIVSVAGAFYALAAFAAVRRLIAAPTVVRGLIPRLVLCIALLLASVGWAVRSEGLHYSLRSQAFKHRNDWAAPPPPPSGDQRAQGLIRRLQADAFARQPVNPRFVPYWFTRWFEE